jgi:hypothetical protein
MAETQPNYPGTMMIDAVVANDELDLATFRISFLRSIVTKFYIAESAQTFQGRAKPLNFTPRLEELRSLGADVEVIQIPPSPDDASFEDAWERGRYQRYWFLEHVAKKHPDATIIFTDIDEVPSHEQLLWAQAHLGPNGLASLPMRFVFRFSNWLLEPAHQKYQPGVILGSAAFRPDIRDGGFPPAQGEKGAHLSYVGFSAEQVKEKFSSFEHVELDLEHLYQGDVLDFANKWGVDHIGRPGQPGFGLLRKAKKNDLNAVLLASISQFPSWYREFPQKALVRRLVASSALSSFRSSANINYLQDPERAPFDIRFIRHLGIIFAHTAIRVTRTGSLLKKLQSLTQQ